ncbi:MAG: type II toxin-antitoxin system HicB family antitoxin [Cellvibrionales bacterium]|jgi:antitoxin HicB|nr:type II toxin-antitoxin system HicB family antitoxin [Cellvibrionales bacterium]MBK8676867.1 type II toxin-antitoxin system HicB family antitoxin [Cellvibrionales bacterium]HRF87245.1 type II toxin-antitoxin system HicB family antitoxin [Pseudomonadales bacterium]HRG49702.1 type II toxin-antitoxin system HicB family antitoxin [Pseudomonadales bacterium]
MKLYPARFTKEPEGGYTVTFRDVPEAITYGETQEEAHTQAVDALVTAMDFYFEDKRTVPDPSQPRKGEALVELPLSVAIKVELLNTQIKQRVRPAELASRMGVRPQEVTRIMNLHHTTKIDTLAKAAAALGKRLDMSLA